MFQWHFKMKFALAIFLLLTVFTLKNSAQSVEFLQRYGEPRKVGVVYLIQLVSTPQLYSQDDEELDNSILGRNEFNSLPVPSKLLNTLSPPNNFDKEIKDDSGRIKRSASRCARCGGGGGGYPGGGGFGGGGYGGGGGGSWSQSQASSSSGSFGGGFGRGKGGYGK